MASINISVRKEAYDFLKRLKTKERSFSDVILSFKNEKKDVLQFFGLLKDSDCATKEKNTSDLRNSFNKRLVK